MSSGYTYGRVRGIIVEVPRIDRKSNGPDSVVLYLVCGYHTPPNGRPHEIRASVRSYQRRHVDAIGAMNKGMEVEASGRLAATAYADHAGGRVWASPLLVIDEDARPSDAGLAVEGVEV